MTKTVLITGSAGFTGRYMCEYLAGLKNRPKIVGIDVIDGAECNCDCYYSLDLGNDKRLFDIIEDIKPDIIIHLAGTFGIDDPQGIYRVNVLSIAALLEAARLHTPDVTFITTGSAAEYGRIDEKMLPADENNPCNPVMPYGLSKLMATQLAMYYHRVHNIDTMVVRPFQLIGKGVTTRLAPGAFAAQLCSVIKEGMGVIKVGNLESSRDFLAVEDAVEAIWTLCEKPAPGEIFNLCSGIPTKISNLLNMMIVYCNADVKIEVDQARLRGKKDVSVVYGSYKKLKNYCGWQPKIELDNSVRTMFE